MEEDNEEKEEEKEAEEEEETALKEALQDAASLADCFAREFHGDLLYLSIISRSFCSHEKESGRT